MIGLTVIIVGIFIILLASEIIWRKQLLKGELQRKFVHITGGTFAIFWPWLTSWRYIQLVGMVLLAGVLFNRIKKFSHFSDGVRRKTYGDIFSPIAITACATLTIEPIVYAVAISHLAIADGLAAVFGSRAGKRWQYKIFGQTKTVIGTMTFWIVSVLILGGGLLFAYQIISFDQYALVLIFLPPLLTFLENVSVFGSDNITVPLATLGILENIKIF